MVRVVAERLRGDGLRIWFDEWEIRPGDRIPAKIEAGLEHSRVLVLCMSDSAFGSDWAQLEAGTFRFRDPLNQQRRFIPLRLDDALIKGSLAQFLYIHRLPQDREPEFAKLLEACRSIAKPDIMLVKGFKKAPRLDSIPNMPHSRESHGFPWTEWRPAGCYTGTAAKLICVAHNAWQLCKYLRRDPNLFADETSPITQDDVVSCLACASEMCQWIESDFNPDHLRFGDPLRRTRVLFGCDERTKTAIAELRMCFDKVLVETGWECICEGQSVSFSAACDGIVPEVRDETIRLLETAVFELRDAIEANPPNASPPSELKSVLEVDETKFWTTPYLLDQVILGNGKRFPINTTDIRRVAGTESFCCPKARFQLPPTVVEALDANLRTSGFLQNGQVAVYVGPQDTIESVCDCLSNLPPRLDYCMLDLNLRVLAKLDQVLWADAASESETQSFKSKKHDELLTSVRSIADEGLGNGQRVTIMQSLADAGCDVLVEFSHSTLKCGVQVKSWGDIGARDFTNKTLAQIQESRRHGLRRLWLFLCGDLTDASQKEKVRQLQSRLSQADDYVRVVPPERAWNLLFGSLVSAPEREF